jgi:hypothetical protein
MYIRFIVVINMALSFGATYILTVVVVFFFFFFFARSR